MEQKLLFYERFGVHEYYIYDPELVELTGWQRVGNELREIPQMNGWTSPLLQIRFVMSPSSLKILRPDGELFLTFAELVEQRDQLTEQRDQLPGQRDAERHRADRLAAQLRAMGIELEA
jgi:hypothetical protein